MFLIRPATLLDGRDLLALANLPATRGFLTLPHDKPNLARLIQRSSESFHGVLTDPDEGQYLFVLCQERQIVGASLILARHGTSIAPHFYLQVDPQAQTLQIHAETLGRTELGGLILDPALRGHPAKLGKRLSFVRLHFILSHPKLFKDRIIAELLPVLTPEGDSLVWQALGQRFTDLSYAEANRRAAQDKAYIRHGFPKEKIPIASLPPEVQKLLGVPGLATQAAARVLSEAGFSYLEQIDPFDGGPHYGARQEEINELLVHKFLFDRGLTGLHEVRLELP